ncbi:MAG: hypothetical protein HY544_03455 [Candidatus Diapherotrites archaeon]|uniref:ATP-cone domain-containing protein n=1 Tax=Candidatus Iainarchaeum sp. TaxID=3101447 RepID=A0A8T3YKI0_9ARCH|nr:hypothetical protein [Candidatus Diapherotrites archaeon]
MENDATIKETLQQIASECEESGASEWQALKVVQALAQFDGNEQQLRRKAGEILAGLNPEAAKVFLSFEKLKVYTSREKLEPFDRGNIIKSLLKETGVSRHVAEKIGGEVEDKIKDLNIAYLNTQLIREMVNVRLLEYGHESIHNEYARIGIPIFEVRKKLDAGHFDNPEILREYNWLAVIPAKARQMHFEGTIHVFAPEDFSTKLFASAKFLEGGKDSLVLEASKLDMILSEPLLPRAFNFSIAGTGSKSRKKSQEECGAVDRLFRLSGRKRQAELCLFNDFEWRELSSKKKHGIMLANELLSSQLESFEVYVSVDSKYQLKLLDKDAGKYSVIVANNSRERILKFGFGALACDGGTVLQLVGVNMQRIAEASGFKESAFRSMILEVVEECEKLCERKREALATRAYIPEKLLKESCSAVAFAGLASACSGINPAEPEKCATEVIETFQNARFSALELGAEESKNIFGIPGEATRTQGMLTKAPAKTRRSYGFAYAAETAREAETLLTDVPCVKYSLSKHTL